MTALLTVEKLVKRFPIAGSKQQVQAINDVSFSIAPGETLGLVGESGSGKTTVGRAIVGLLKPSAGRILFKGEEIGGSGRSRAHLLGKIQLVFQEPSESLDPRLKMGKSLEEPLVALKVNAPERRRRVREAMELVRLDPELLDAYASELSAGQQQRIGIARAMVTDPELVILDEPTSALDPTARAEIIDLLRRIQARRDTSYLFISHDLSTVRFVSHRVAVMYLGMIVEQGDAATLFDQPRHPYSTGLLSSVMLPHPYLRMQSSVSLAGEIPSPINLPKGCFLAGRCPFVLERCRTEMPPATLVSPGHTTHCFRSDEVARATPASQTFSEFLRETQRILAKPAPSTLTTRTEI